MKILNLISGAVSLALIATMGYGAMGCGCPKEEPVPPPTEDVQPLPEYNPPPVTPVPLQEPEKPPIEEPENLEARVNVNYEVLRREGDKYYYHLTIEEKNGVDVIFDSLVAQFVNTGFTETADKDSISKAYGTHILKGGEKWEKERWFQTPTPDTYKEIWNGIDANGNSVTASFIISTSEFK